jgi:hypothetical protein
MTAVMQDVSGAVLSRIPDGVVTDLMSSDAILRCKAEHVVVTCAHDVRTLPNQNATPVHTTH